MRQLALAAALVILFVGAAPAQTVRVEIGDNGTYPAGEWVNCRVSGLDNEAVSVTVNVNDMFLREMRVERGVAEGQIIIPDEAPAIAVRTHRRAQLRIPPFVRIAPEDLARLTCIKDAQHPGSVRPDLYGIFGRPEWPAAAKRSTAALFAGVLVAWALWVVLPRRRGAGWAVLIGVLAACALFSFLALSRTSLRRESVSIFEGRENDSFGMLTEVRSCAHLRSEGDEAQPILEDFKGAVPVAFSRSDWIERPILVDERGVIRQRVRVPSRDVALRVERMAEPENRPDVPSPGSRALNLRKATERWWRERHTSDSSRYAISWVVSYEASGAFSAGTLVVVPFEPVPPAP